MDRSKAAATLARRLRAAHGRVQDDRGHGHPERSADLRRDAGDGAGVRDLLRQEVLLTLRPPPDEAIKEIVDTIFLPLVTP
ncbi:hypothetical protein [Cellulomonas sp.]